MKVRTKAREKALSTLEVIALMIAYIFGVIFVWLPFLIGRLFGRIKVLHPERLPTSLKNVVIPFNHPSVMDPFIIAGLLFFKYFIRHPFTQAPVIAAGKELYGSLLLRPFRFVMISVDRENKDKEALSARALRKAERPVMICPEGGRTFKQKSWTYCSTGNNNNGGRIGQLKNGVGLLVQQTGATVLPIAIIGSDKIWPNSKKWLFPRLFVFWKKVTIIVGQPIKFNENELSDLGHKAAREAVTKTMHRNLLQLLQEAI